MTKAYRPYTLDQQLLLPPDMRQWLPEGDLALFISDVVDELDLAAIYRAYETGDGRGQPPYEPAMMVKVLLYAYCTGLRSSRKIEQATYRDVAIRVVAGDQHPDQDPGGQGRVGAAGARRRRARRRRGAREAGGARAARGLGQGRGVPKVPDPAQAQPEPGAQYNFTDPASRIMLDGASKSWVQAYNAQAVVDAQAQVIVACAVTQEATDVQQFVPLLTQVQTNTGQRPAMVTADAGYFSEANLTAATVEGIDCYVPPDRHTHGRTQAPTARTRSAVAEWMREKLRAPEGRQVYARRKAIVEPVFGQAKEGRAFRRFSFRGYDKVTAEWALICLTHNLLKLFRVPTCPQPA